MSQGSVVIQLYQGAGLPKHWHQPVLHCVLKHQCCHQYPADAFKHAHNSSGATWWGCMHYSKALSDVLDRNVVCILEFSEMRFVKVPAGIKKKRHH